MPERTRRAVRALADHVPAFGGATVRFRPGGAVQEQGAGHLVTAASSAAS
jgi:hypothetical protein